MKFYKESAKVKQKNILYLQKSRKDNKLHKSTPLPAKYPDFNVDQLDAIRSELKQDELYRFSQTVDAEYEKRFITLYLNFSPMKDFLRPKSMIAQFYRNFRAKFPKTHAVLVLVVSARSHRVELANQFHHLPHSIDDPGFDDDSDDDRHMLELTMRERVIIEYFLSLIRIKSQKKLKF